MVMNTEIAASGYGQYEKGVTGMIIEERWEEG
jgi:hypothetical protein